MPTKIVFGQRVFPGRSQDREGRLGPGMDCYRIFLIAVPVCSFSLFRRSFITPLIIRYNGLLKRLNSYRNASSHPEEVSLSQCWASAHLLKRYWQPPQQSPCHPRPRRDGMHGYSRSPRESCERLPRVTPPSAESLSLQSGDRLAG